MLLELNIRNFALIESVSISFGEGLNTLTGETGAGKSILIDALQAAIGGRVGSDVIRRGCEYAEVEALFQLPEGSEIRLRLDELGLAADEDPGLLLIFRRIQREGRPICRVNGRLSTLAVVRELTAPLIEFCGQNQHQSILKESAQRLALDRYGGKECQEVSAELRRQVLRLRSLRSELERLRDDAQNRERQIDLLRFQIEEIDQAGLDPAEEEKLQHRRSVLMNAHKIKSALQEISAGLLEGDGHGRPAMDVLAHCSAMLQEVASISPELAGMSEAFEGAYIQLREVVRDLSTMGNDFEMADGELDLVETRLNEIQRLKRKYGETIPEILQFRDQLQHELDRLENHEVQLTHLQTEMDAVERESEKLGSRLSEARKIAAQHLAEEVTGELRELSMPHARFVIRIDSLPELQVHGRDRIVFLFAANLGEELMPLADAASGGETARFMLALRTVLARFEDVDCLVFDEIDAGIGGKTAEAVGRKLKQIASHTQVLCISHLAVVAAHADMHFKIEKLEEGGRTSTVVTRLTDVDHRIGELARMFGGADASARQHAEALLRSLKNNSG